MDWASIERDVVLRTEARGLRNIDLNASLRPGNVSRLVDGILSSRLLIEDKPAKENQRNNFEEGSSAASTVMLKSLLADIAELQSAIRSQASKVEQYGTVYNRREQDVTQVRKNLDALFDRVNQIEAAIQGKSSDVDVVELYSDIQLRLKRVESNVDGLEENARNYNVQFATKDAFAKLLGTIFEQLKSLSAMVEASKHECTHASILFDALASSFVMLNGEDSAHQLDLVTSFSREINKDHLSRILTDALMRSVDGSIQAHLKPAMAVMHSSLLELIEELREKQDHAVASMRNSFQALARQVQEDRGALLLPAQSTSDPKLDASFLAEFNKLKESMTALSAENKSLRESLESQSAIVAQLVSTQETTQTVDAESLLQLRCRCDELDREVFALKLENTAVRGIADAAKTASEETATQLQETEERVTVLNSEVHNKLDTVEGGLKVTIAQINTTLAKKGEAEDVEALAKASRAQAERLATLEAASATRDDLEGLQSKVDVVSSDLNILQGDQASAEKKFTARLTVHDEEIVLLRRQGTDNTEAAGKLTKRFDAYEATMQGKLSSLGTELHHKVAEAVESVGRLTRRFDTLDADAQAKHVTAREVQTKVQSHSEALSELSRKLTLLDGSCNSQFLSAASQQKSLQEEVADFTAKVTRKLDLQEAELLSKFNIRNDRVDALLMQNQESLSKLGDRIELSEHKQAAAFEELTHELRGKVTGAVDLTAQLNRRLETYQSELTSKLTALQSEMNSLNRTTNERINAAIKQTDANLELLQTQLTTKHSELAHKVTNVGDSLAHLAQQQFELSGLQEKQQMDFNTLTGELSSVRVKLEEKLASTVTTFQTSLTQHSKVHTSALAEQKYDLLQLTSRVALLEQLIRYGQDLEDQTLASAAGGLSLNALGALSGSGSGSRTGSPKATGLAPRPADPDLRARFSELRATVEALGAEFASQKAESDSRLDAFKVSLAALRSQYEEEVQEIREVLGSQGRVVNRSEQVTKSLQAQIDILQVEVQQLGEEMESSRGAAIAARFETASTEASPTKPAALDSPDRARVLPMMSSKQSPGRSAVSGAGSTALPAAPAKSPTKDSEKTVKFSPSKHLMKTQSAYPVRNFLAKKFEEEQGQPQSPEAPKSPVGKQGSTSDFDDDGSVHSEGSEVDFPISPPEKNERRSAPDSSFETSVNAFSPGSVSSPPGRSKLTINPGAALTSPSGGKVPTPATPDSPWDEESEFEESPTRASQSGEGPGAAGVATGDGAEEDHDDSSSVDSDIRERGRATRGAGSAAAATASEEPAIRGPAVSQVASFQAAPKSPVKLSGSLLRGGRSNAPSFGGTSKF